LANFGKVCAKHPELRGERRESNRHCIECHREAARKQYYTDIAGFKKRAAQWAKANPEKRQGIAAAWECRNRAYRRALTGQRRAIIHDAAQQLTPAEQALVNTLYVRAVKLTAETGVQYEVDHDKPVARGGKHHPDNMIVVPASINRSKGARYESTLDYLLS
jgi:hypothetical protein